MPAIRILILDCDNCPGKFVFMDTRADEDAVKLLTCRRCGAQKEYRRGKDCIEETEFGEYRGNL